MHKEYLEQALIKMQEDLFFVIKNKRSCYPTKKYPDGKKFENGLKAKESFIRSSKFIDQIHQAVKKSFNEINKNLNFKSAVKYVNWLISDEGKMLINNYKKNQQQLFFFNYK